MLLGHNRTAKGGQATSLPSPSFVREVPARAGYCRLLVGSKRGVGEKLLQEMVPGVWLPL
jgi:hypothetical protein